MHARSGAPPRWLIRTALIRGPPRARHRARSDHARCAPRDRTRARPTDPFHNQGQTEDDVADTALRSPDGASTRTN